MLLLENLFRSKIKRTSVIIWSDKHIYPILGQCEISWPIFIEVPSIKFHCNPSSGSRAGTFGEMNGRTNMTKLRGTFRDHMESF
jgi:hypothetical protein